MIESSSSKLDIFLPKNVYNSAKRIKNSAIFLQIHYIHPKNPDFSAKLSLILPICSQMWTKSHLKSVFKSTD